MEAADNVVHAYDLNMLMPETQLTPDETDMGKSMFTSMPPAAHYQAASKTCSEIFPSPPSRKRDRAEEFNCQSEQQSKRMFMMTGSNRNSSYLSDNVTLISERPTFNLTKPQPPSEAPSEPVSVSAKEFSEYSTEIVLTPTHRYVITRKFMLSLVNDALRNVHPTSEVHKNTSLGETIEVATIDSRGNIQNKDIQLKIESGVPEAIVTEAKYLQFAVQKLVDNAMKFTEYGSITITVKLACHSQVVEIWVIDTGCGIAEESKSSIFRPHFQEDSSISRSRDGLGLSLFNAKAHVRKHLGGDLTLERSNTEGPLQGSEFLIRLPISKLDASFSSASLVGSPPPVVHHPNRPSPWIENGFLPIPIFMDSVASPEPGTHQTPAPTPARKLTPTFRKHRAVNRNLAKEYPLNILIAEDNPINRKVAVGSLRKLGYESSNIELAVDGLEAVRKYEASLLLPLGEHFDAILMDIWMPHMDGYQATKQIFDLARGYREKTKIIAVTADITSESMERARAAGMHGFLAKPYKVLDIEQVIVQYFPHKQKRN